MIGFFLTFMSYEVYLLRFFRVLERHYCSCPYKVSVGCVFN